MKFYVVICLLVAGIYALPNAYMKWACLMLLAALWLVTPVPSPSRERGD